MWEEQRHGRRGEERDGGMGWGVEGKKGHIYPRAPRPPFNRRQPKACDPARVLHYNHHHYVASVVR